MQPDNRPITVDDIAPYLDQHQMDVVLLGVERFRSAVLTERLARAEAQIAEQNGLVEATATEDD